MTIMKRMQHELDWPTDWPSWMARRFWDVPDTFGDIFERSPMRVEEFEADGAVVIRAELPGIDPDDDVEITVSDHQLHLRAERKSSTKEDDVKGWRSEFRYGSFERTMALPPTATDKDVKATYTDGILEVRIPLGREAAAKRVPISRKG